MIISTHFSVFLTTVIISFIVCGLSSPDWITGRLSDTVCVTEFFELMQIQQSRHRSLQSEHVWQYITNSWLCVTVSRHEYSDSVGDGRLTQSTPAEETGAAPTADEMSTRHQHHRHVLLQTNFALLHRLETLVFHLYFPRQSFRVAAAASCSDKDRLSAGFCRPGPAGRVYTTALLRLHTPWLKWGAAMRRRT